MRIVFFGTPEFAVPSLDTLRRGGHEVSAVVTQPDRPHGRSRSKLVAPPVKDAAVAAGLDVLQPERPVGDLFAATLRHTGADLGVVVAYGHILRPDILSIPTRGMINVHASLLPRYRGAAPIAWAIICGERETGITTFQMDAGMDTGPLLLQRPTPIGPEETAGELAERLAVLGAEVLLETLDRLDSLTPRAQESQAATLAPRLRKEDGLLDWTQPAATLAARVRGLNPWPGATTVAPGGRLLIWRARAIVGRGEPGVLTAVEGRLVVGTGAGLLEPLEVQPENRRAMDWDAYLRGARLGLGAPLGATVPRS